MILTFMLLTLICQITMVVRMQWEEGLKFGLLCFVINIMSALIT